MNKRAWISVLVLVLISYSYFKNKTPLLDPTKSAVPVSARPVKIMKIADETESIGALTARSIEITPEIAGHINKIFFRDGTLVNKNDTLYQLNDEVYQSQYESAKAKYEFSANTYQRMAQLGKTGVVTKQAIDQALADRAEKKADFEQSLVLYQKMKLTAPFAGIVGKGKVNPGDYVTIGQGLVTLTDTQKLRVEYSVPEKFYSQLKLGQRAEVKSSAYPDQIFIAKLAFISPTINTENRSIQLYAELENKNNLLAPGMFVNVKQILSDEHDALMIPARSLIPVMNGLEIYKVVNGQAQMVNVTIGKRIKEYVQITQGLQSGDLIVTDGQFKLKDKMPVKLIS